MNPALPHPPSLEQHALGQIFELIEPNDQFHSGEPLSLAIGNDRSKS